MDAEEIKAFFFEAMRAGWATSAQKQPILGLTGSKSISFKKHGLILVDYYFVNPGSSHSYGTTLILAMEDMPRFGFVERPVWVMHYGGWYDKRVIPFLKRTLMHNYNEGVFMGGRGQERLEGEDHTLQYVNKVEQNDFSNFRGDEQIITTSEQWKVPVGQKMGEHHYFGGLLF